MNIFIYIKTKNKDKQKYPTASVKEKKSLEYITDNKTAVQINFTYRP